MITVRFPNGQALTYNDANFLTHPDEQRPYASLYTRKNGRYIAQVPLECIIEFQPPCRVHNPLRDKLDEHVAKQLTSIKNQLSRVLTAARKGKVK